VVDLFSFPVLIPVGKESRTTGKLTVAMLRSLSRPGRYGDGGTLFLVVAPGGSKSWVQRVTIGSRRRDLGLGGWPVVSLAKARQRAFANRVAVSDGRNPLAEKRKVRTLTFREAALKTYEANRPRWRGDRTATIWKQQMERHAFPILADLPVDEIGREDVLRCLTPIWTAHPDIARKLGGTALCVTSLVLSWRVLGQTLRKALPSRELTTRKRSGPNCAVWPTPSAARECGAYSPYRRFAVWVTGRCCW